MAQLPEINIAPQSFRLPLARPPVNPIPEAARQLAHTTERQVNILANTILRQKQLIQDHESLMYFYKQHADLETAVDTIRDPQEKLSVYRQGFNDVMSDVHDKYPGMSDYANLKLAEIAEMRSDHFTTSIMTKLDRQNRIDYKANLATMSKEASEARSPEEMQKIEQLGLGMIKQYQDTGAISEAEVGRDAFNFLHTIRLTHFQNLAQVDPKSALALKQEEIMLNPKEFSEIQTMAHQRLEHKYDTEDTEMKNRRKAATLSVFNGEFNDNPQGLLDLRNTGVISEETFQAGLSRMPTDQTAKNALLNVMDNTEWDTPEDLERFEHNYITGNRLLSHSDHAYLTGQVNDRKTKLQDDISFNGAKLIHKLNKYAVEKGGRFATSKNSPYRSQVSAILDANKVEIEKHKNQSIDDQMKIYDKYKAQIDKTFPEKDDVSDLMNNADKPASGDIVDKLDELNNDLPEWPYER